MVRPPFCEKLNMKRGIWTPEEDAKMIAYVSKHGPGNWSDVPRKAGLKRCGKSCRLRWNNYLRPDLKHDNFTPQEEKMIVRLHAAIGSRWSIIAQQLPGRTDNDVKNYWNTRLRKKLTEMGIDPITHKPFSQILADYGNFLGGFAKPGTRIRSLNRDQKHASFIPAAEEQYPIATEGVSNINSHFRSTFSSTELESTRECFFTDNFIANNPNNNNNNQSSDLLGPLQAMKLVTKAASWILDDPIPPIFPEEDSLSPTTSSSSTCSTAAKEKPGLTCAWRDFLCEDEFLPADDHAQEEETNVQFSSKSFLGQSQNLTPQFQDVIPKVEIDNVVTVTSNLGNEVMGFGVPGHGFQAPSSSNSSFIDGILDRENETFLELSCLLEDPFHF